MPRAESAMASFVFDADSLAHLLTAVGPPAFRSAACRIDGDALRLDLRGIRSGLSLFGREIGTIGAEVAVRAQRVSARAIAIAWELGPVAGIPASLMRTLAHSKVIQPVLNRLLARWSVAGAVELHESSATIHLDRLPGRGGIMRLVHCDRFAIPAAKGQAVAGTFRIEPAQAPSSPSASAPKRSRQG
jgi:hypothetical protein